MAIHLNGAFGRVVGRHELLDLGDQLLDAGEAAPSDRTLGDDPVAEGPRSGSSAPPG